MIRESAGRWAYAGFMLLAMLVFFLVRRWMRPIPAIAQLTRAERFCLAGAAFVGGVIGARLPFINSLTFETIWLTDGKTITTGLIGAYVAVEVVKRLLGIRIKTGDSYALPLAAAIGLGRWGCFFNGCCAGTPTDMPWGIDFGDGLRRHPTQIYESLFHYGMMLVVFLLMRRHWFIGHRLQIYLMGYAAYRFLTEFIRPEPIHFGLTFYQWTSLVFGIALAGQWVVEKRNESRPRFMPRSL